MDNTANRTADATKSAQNKPPREQFAMVPRSWLDPKISHRQRSVGMAILMHFDPTHPDQCFPSIPLIAEMAHVDERDVRRDIRALVAAGALIVTARKNSSNLYRPAGVAQILKAPHQGGDTPSPPVGDTPMPQGGDTPRGTLGETPPNPLGGTPLQTDHVSPQLSKAAAGAAFSSEKVNERAADLAGEIFDRSIAEKIRAKHKASDRAKVIAADVASATTLLDEYPLTEIQGRVDRVVAAIRQGRITKRELSCAALLRTWDWTLDVAGEPLDRYDQNTDPDFDPHAGVEYAEHIERSPKEAALVAELMAQAKRKGPTPKKQKGWLKDGTEFYRSPDAFIPGWCSMPPIPSSSPHELAEVKVFLGGYGREGPEPPRIRGWLSDGTEFYRPDDVEIPGWSDIPPIGVEL